MAVFGEEETVAGGDVGRVLREKGWTDERDHKGLCPVYWHHSKPEVSVYLEDEREYSLRELLEKLKPCFDDMEKLCFFVKLRASIKQVSEGSGSPA